MTPSHFIKVLIILLKGERHSLFRALRHRNFQLYLSGQFISLIGTWMQQLATNWLVYRLTHSVFWLGVANFSSQIPSFILGAFAGVIVDRSNRHLLLKWTQGLSAVQALIFFLLVYSQKITVWQILALSIFLGIVNAIDMPTRQSFVIQMIGDKRDLPNAIALNSSVMNATRLIGPALAGIVIASAGESVCYFLNAISYLGVLYALFKIRVEVPQKPSRREPIVESLKAGMRFAFQTRTIGTLLVLLSILSLIGAPYMTLFPAMADQLYKGGAHTLGLLTSATGIGAFAASFFLASQKSSLKLGSWIAACAWIFGGGVIALALVHSLHFALPVLFILGFSMMMQMAGSNVVIQTLVDDDKRGRVMSLYSLALLGVAPFGSLLIGVIADGIGLMPTLLILGCVYLGVASWFSRRWGGLNQHFQGLMQRQNEVEAG